MSQNSYWFYISSSIKQHLLLGKNKFYLKIFLIISYMYHRKITFVIIVWSELAPNFDIQPQILEKVDFVNLKPWRINRLFESHIKKYPR